ncbi:MAG TPA: hypothetical protein VFQ61_00890 [Polyangiaceae bacterium]|nr:hypothetical protein [Polyangiaceae bacterium]
MNSPSASSAPPESQLTADRPPRARFKPSYYAVLAAACALAIWQLKLAPFLLVGAFIARVALSRDEARATYALSWLSMGLALVAFVRFLLLEAVPGIVQGGTRATQDAAVSKLREILAAEDALRRNAQWDPDHDGVGSAARLDELTGRKPIRGLRSLEAPLLERYPAPVETAIGPAVELGGYLFAVCLPTSEGGFSARLDAAIDDELAERRFLAYAWPARAGQGLNQTFFIDEHENIRKTSSARYIGASGAPDCNAALGASSEWQDWKHKRPRRTLPGDHPR